MHSGGEVPFEKVPDETSPRVEEIKPCLARCDKTEDDPCCRMRRVRLRRGQECPEIRICIANGLRFETSSIAPSIVES